jgi:hypothetical protein
MAAKKSQRVGENAPLEDTIKLIQTKFGEGAIMGINRRSVSLVFQQDLWA